MNNITSPRSENQGVTMKCAEDYGWECESTPAYEITEKESDL